MSWARVQDVSARRQRCPVSDIHFPLLRLSVDQDRRTRSWTHSCSATRPANLSFASSAPPSESFCTFSFHPTLYAHVFYIIAPLHLSYTNRAGLLIVYHKKTDMYAATSSPGPSSSAGRFFPPPFRLDRHPPESQQSVRVMGWFTDCASSEEVGQI